MYGIEATVIPPPHAVSAEGTQDAPAALHDWGDGYHLVVSRLLPYKNVDVVINAFRGLNERLVVVGKGPMEAELRAALPPNVRLLCGISDSELRWVYSHATTLVAASYEDFGLAPLEAASFGVPTLALRAGGFLDTIDEQVNGSFFDTVGVPQIRHAVTENSDKTWNPAAIRKHAELFSEDRFAERIRQQLQHVLAAS